MPDGTREQVQVKLQKAREFYDLAGMVVDEYQNVAASLAAVSGINSADVILLITYGGYNRSASHEQAATRLRSSGHRPAARHLSALLGAKDRAQYSAKLCSSTEARAALKDSDRLLRQAEALASERGYIP